MSAAKPPFHKPDFWFADSGSVCVVKGQDGFYTVYSEPGIGVTEAILGGPYPLEFTAQKEARDLALDFGVRWLPHGQGHQS